MLVFNLKKKWFDKIKRGEKTHEYREVKDFWTDRFVKEWFAVDKKIAPDIFLNCKIKLLEYLEKGNSICCPYTKIQFMNGMFSEEKRPRMYAKFISMKIVDGKTTDLKINKPVYDIEFELIKED